MVSKGSSHRHKLLWTSAVLKFPVVGNRWLCWAAQPHGMKFVWAAKLRNWSQWGRQKVSLISTHLCLYRIPGYIGFSGKRVLCSFWIAVWTRARLSRGSELWSSQHRALSLSSGACWTTLTDANAHLEPGWAGSREGELLLHLSPFSGRAVTPSAPAPRTPPSCLL